MFSLKRVLRAFGTHSIDVFEWSQSNVKMRRLPPNSQWSTLATPCQKLTFSGWELAHAIIKADFLSFPTSFLPGIGFLLQIESLLDLGSSQNMRLLPGGSRFLNDFSQTSVSGRIGQGLAILFAQQKGYQFVAHLTTDDEVIKHRATSKKLKRVADFLFDSKQHGRMILESKGAFQQPGNNPSHVKSVLKTALTKQVENWMPVISPPAKKGIVTYSCIREVGAPEPSALIFVDPEGGDESRPLELPPSWLMRRNYSGWLSVMGFHASGQRLRTGQVHNLQDYEFFLADIQGGIYAFPSFSIRQPFFCDFDLIWDSIHGIEVSALSAISEALKGDDRALLEYPGVSYETGDRIPDSYHSIFPDGTFFGSLRKEEIRTLRLGTFRL